MSFNRITIVGNLGKDPEIRYTAKGLAICNFTMASNETRKDKEGKDVEVVTWFRITLYGKQAEIASAHLSKGRPAYIMGRLRLEQWTDKETRPRATLEVDAIDFQFVGDKIGDRGGSSGGGF